MKNLLLFLVVLLVGGCALFDDQSTPEGYVRHCVRQLDKRALYAGTKEWKAKKDSILHVLSDLPDMDAARVLVSEAANVAGGKHSRLVPPVKDTASYIEHLPEVKLIEDGIAYILLPEHMGVKVSDSLYVYTVLDFLRDNQEASGVVVDLRGNTGGNMYHMISALSPLLPDGIVLKFKGPKFTTPLTLSFIMKVARIPVHGIGKFQVPVAILTDDWTASSGEATLLCFRGLDNVRTFGIPTAGYASANMVHALADGYSLLITTSCDEARTGEVFCDDPIAPDVTTDTPLEDAVSWILSAKAVTR